MEQYVAKHFSALRNRMSQRITNVINQVNVNSPLHARVSFVRARWLVRLWFFLTRIFQLTAEIGTCCKMGEHGRISF